MQIKNILYPYLDEAIDNYYASEEPEEEGHVILNESIGSDAIMTFGPAWRVLDRNLIVVEGIYSNYNPDTQEWEPDWSLTLIYDNVPDNQFDINKYVYFEQDPPTTSIHNYLQAVRQNIKELVG